MSDQLRQERDYYRHALEVIEQRLREDSKPLSEFINRAMAELPNLTDDEKRVVNRAWKDSVYSSAIHAQIILSLKEGDAVPNRPTLPDAPIESE